MIFEDWGNSHKATVMKFEGSNWVNVGNAGFSAGQALFTNIAFSQSGQLFVAYEDYAYYEKATVMKFDGINWVNVGNAGFSASWANFTSLAISASGVPYVAYSDYGNSDKATVMKYDSVFMGINDIRGSQVSIYPNPTTDYIIIETSEIPANSFLSIMNFCGLELISRLITNPKTQLDITNLPCGVYFVRLTNERNVTMGKFIKN